MAFVKLVPEEQADVQVKQLYEQIKKSYGFLPNYFQALGRDPGLVQVQMALGGAINKDGALPKVVKEQIGLVVSGINSSSYCVAIHMEILRTLGVEKALGKKLAIDYPNAPVGEKVQALFRFADKLTRKSDDIETSDVEALRQAGWSEAEIFDAVMTVAYFNFVNRVSIGLGLMPDF